MIPVINIVINRKPIDEPLFQMLLSKVQKEKQIRILQQRMKQNADNMLIGEILTRVTIQSVFNIDFMAQSFAYGAYGKPYLKNDPTIHFNRSHSGQYVACAVYNRPIGIDIQKIRNIDYHVMRKVCNKAEIACIDQSVDKSKAFIKLWTKKEAVLKERGVGIGFSDMKKCLENKCVKTFRFCDCWISIYTETGCNETFDFSLQYVKV